MKICFVHEEYPEETNFGGIATYQKNMAVNMVKLNHKVIVICRGLYKNQHYVDDGVEIYRVHQKKTNNQVKDYVEYRKKISKLLYKLQKNNLIDIIEVPDWGAETVLFEKYRRVPLVVRLHTPLKVWLQYNQNDFGEVTDTMLSWEESMIKKADCITCCSNILKDICSDCFDIDRKRIMVTPNPPDLRNFYLDNSVKKEKRIIYVGSLEERKGVIVLAKALNIFLEKYPDVYVDFIGKDTDRNYKNISTIKLIKSLVKSKFKNRLNFIGQIQNKDINYYLNRAKVAIFPSMFDNFPYVVLESMATGIHIIGSKNSGMVEMLDDNNSIYDTGNEIDLAKRIEIKYNLKTRINRRNIKRVNDFYMPEIVVKNMIDIYNSVINKYKSYLVTKEDIQNILKVCLKKDNIKVLQFKRAKSGVANIVYIVKTNCGKYVVKKYLYDYDFKLAKKLCDIYKKNSIKVCESINKVPILFKNNKYNIFPYINHKSSLKKTKIKIFNDTLNTDRKINSKNCILDKCDSYLKNLKTIKIPDSISEDVNIVIKNYECIRKKINTKECYINHGDLSTKNIVHNSIIDFDECNVSFKLYDFAVITVKNYRPSKYVKDSRLNKLLQKSNVSHDLEDAKLIINFYLLKILLEKFYLHAVSKIDLFSKGQKKDDYHKYLSILGKITKKKT